MLSVPMQGCTRMCSDLQAALDILWAYVRGYFVLLHMHRTQRSQYEVLQQPRMYHVNTQAGDLHRREGQSDVSLKEFFKEHKHFYNGF